MKHNIVHKLRAGLTIGLLVLSLSASADPPVATTLGATVPAAAMPAATAPRATTMTPKQIAMKARTILKQLSELGAVVDLSRDEGTGGLTVACVCTPPVGPGGTGIYVPHPVPPPPEVILNLLKGFTLVAALGQAKIPEMNLERATITIRSVPGSAGRSVDPISPIDGHSTNIASR
jgi:hypothetical protein